MSKQAYIVPTDWLKENHPKDDWDAQVFPADPTQTLLIVTWENPNHEVEYEANAEVSHLGLPWEPLPDNATTLIASLAPVSGKLSLSQQLDATPVSVARALRNLEWPAARLMH